MAQTTTVTKTDDLDGTKAAETVAFSLDGAAYEIDLSAKNARTLRKALTEYVDAGRKVARSVPAGRTSHAPAGRSDSAELAVIRAWATDNDIPVAARGRVSADVRAQYEAACGS